MPWSSLERSERALVLVSLAQFACGLTGATVAIRRGHAFDLGFVKGAPGRVARDAVGVGTAFSAPGPMLATQAFLTTVLATRRDTRAATGLEVLGALMTSGYLAERSVRERLGRQGWETFESSLVAAGLGLSVGMSLLGRRIRTGHLETSPVVVTGPAAADRTSTARAQPGVRRTSRPAR